MDGEAGFGIGAVHDGSARRFLEVEVTTHEVGVEMRFEDVPDGGIALGSQLEVAIDIPEGIDDGGLSFTFYIVSGLT
jgi:hypothetical protein